MAFLLHTYPYRETSLIAEIWSRSYGRITVLAKGARRPYSTLRSVLMAFQPLLMGWTGKSPLKTLIQAEWQGGQPLLTGRALLCGYYLNELLLRLVAREDAHPGLFDAYAQALLQLMQGQQGLSGVLRRFELMLLHEIGYGPILDRTVDGRELVPDLHYIYVVEQGLTPRPSSDFSGEIPTATGRCLLAMSRGDFSASQTLQESKALLRYLIQPHLEGKPLQARRILTEILEL